MINHELQNYDYSEGIEFKPLMPEVMKAEGVETVGKDQLETIDIQAFFKDDSE